MRTVVLPFLLAAALTAAWSGSSAAADLYLSGGMLLSSAGADATGSTDFFTISGNDADAAPGIGGALGLRLSPAEAVPHLEWLEARRWALRFEVEGLLGRDYELRTEGGDGFFSDVQSWSTLGNVWVDLPLHPALARVFGRIPLLEPLFVYGGGGAGLASLDVETTDNVSRGQESALNFAWQAGGGIAYEFTEWATLSLGYRYLDLGEVETQLRFTGGGAPVGSHALDFTAHEVLTSLRIDFYSAPLADLSPSRWRLPRWRRPFGD